MLKTQRFGLLPQVPLNLVRQEARLNNKAYTHYVQVSLQEQIDVTVAGTGIRNRGSAFASLLELGINDNGDDRVLIDGPTGRFITEMFSISPIAARRLGSPAVQGAPTIHGAVRAWVRRAPSGYHT